MPCTLTNHFAKCRLWLSIPLVQSVDVSKNVIVLDIVVDFREDEFAAAAHTQQDKQVQMKVLMNLHYFMGCYCCSSARVRSALDRGKNVYSF